MEKHRAIGFRFPKSFIKTSILWFLLIYLLHIDDHKSSRFDPCLGFGFSEVGAGVSP